MELPVLFSSAFAAQDPRDIDLAVAFAPDAERRILEVSDALGAAFHTDQLDIMDLDQAGPVARQRALTRGEILFQAFLKAFSERQLWAMMEFMNTCWLRRLQRGVLAHG